MVVEAKNSLESFSTFITIKNYEKRTTLNKSPNNILL